LWKPIKTTKTLDHYIVTLSKKDPFKSSKAIAAEIGNLVSAPTIRRRLQDANLPGRIAKKVQHAQKKYHHEANFCKGPQRLGRMHRGEKMEKHIRER